MTSKTVEAVAFDCDGVLVDSRRSYDEAMISVSEALARRFAGAELSLKTVGPRLVERLKMTGGFNNDWDTTYALTVFAAMAAGSRRGAAVELERLVGEVVELRRPIGFGAVETVVSKADSKGRAVAARVKAELGYPGGPPKSVLATSFDEAYYGGGLFRGIYGVEPAFHGGRGLIENEKVLVSLRTLRSLGALFHGKLALVTGRTRAGTEHTLGGLMSFFDLGASTFVGDAFRRPVESRSAPRYSKPSPLGLIRAMNHWGVDTLLYVGDSSEDAMMAERARRAGRMVVFAAVCGSGGSRDSYFRAHGSDLILDSVNELPKALTSGTGG